MVKIVKSTIFKLDIWKRTSFPNICLSIWLALFLRDLVFQGLSLLVSLELFFHSSSFKWYVHSIVNYLYFSGWEVVVDVNFIALLSDYQLAVIKIQKLVEALNLISLIFIWIWQILFWQGKNGELFFTVTSKTVSLFSFVLIKIMPGITQWASLTRSRICRFFER